MISETFILYTLLPYICFPFLCWIKFCSGYFRLFFFHLGHKKVVAGRIRQVVVLYSNDCMGIGLGGLSTGRLRLYLILQNIKFYR